MEVDLQNTIDDLKKAQDDLLERRLHEIAELRMNLLHELNLETQIRVDSSFENLSSQVEHTQIQKMNIYEQLLDHFKELEQFQHEATLENISSRINNTLSHLPSFRTISILFLAADPTDASRLRLGKEFSEIQERLKSAKLRDNFRLELPQLSVRPIDICQALLDVEPQIVHFSGHATSDGALYFENQLGHTHLVLPEAMSALFEQFSDQVECVILNACYSEIQANAISKHIKYVIGMNQAIGDEAAATFASGFYQALGAGCTIDDAYKLGCVLIRLQNIDEYMTPTLTTQELAN